MNQKNFDYKFKFYNKNRKSILNLTSQFLSTYYICMANLNATKNVQVSKTRVAESDKRKKLPLMSPTVVVTQSQSKIPITRRVHCKFNSFTVPLQRTQHSILQFYNVNNILIIQIHFMLLFTKYFGLFQFYPNYTLGIPFV